jgi:hypothetical protein
MSVVSFPFHYPVAYGIEIAAPLQGSLHNQCTSLQGSAFCMPCSGGGHGASGPRHDAGTGMIRLSYHE